MSLNVDRVWGTERCNSNEDDDVGTCSRRKFIRSSRSVTLRLFVYSRVTGENVISAKKTRLLLRGRDIPSFNIVLMTIRGPTIEVVIATGFRCQESDTKALEEWGETETCSFGCSEQTSEHVNQSSCTCMWV